MQVIKHIGNDADDINEKEEVERLQVSKQTLFAKEPSQDAHSELTNVRVGLYFSFSSQN